MANVNRRVDNRLTDIQRSGRASSPGASLSDPWGDDSLPGLANAVREVCLRCDWTRTDGHTGRTLAITSAREQEGKTSLAWAVAVATAQDTGASVLLVDCDLLHPTAAADIGAGNSSGLTELLEGDDDYATSLTESLADTALSNLRLLPAGRGSRTPSRLLRSARMLAILGELQRRFAFVILDLPAVLQSTEAVALSKLADGVVVIVRSGVSDERVVQHALNLMAGAKIHGVVLNQWRPAAPRTLRRLIER